MTRPSPFACDLAGNIRRGRRGGQEQKCTGLRSVSLEAVYQEALAIELADRSIPFQREQELPIDYKGRRLPCKYRADFVCYEDIMSN